MTDYLMWARAMVDLCHARPTWANLFSSAAREPRDLLQTHLERAGLATLQHHMAQTTSWGQPALIAHLRQHYTLHSAHQVLITSGASMAYVVVCAALLQPGGHALVETPVYQPFTNVLRAFGARIRALPRPAPDYQPDPDRVAALLQPDTRLIVLSNLHNPSGALMDDDTLRTIAAIAARHNAWLVVDEVYRDLAPDSPHHARTAALLADNIIAISSFSKAYGLGRLRVGWIFSANDAITTRLREQHVLLDNSLSALDQTVATIVAEHFNAYRQHGQATVAGNRPALEHFATVMQAAGILTGDVPAHGCTYFPAVNGLDSTDALVWELREQDGVVVVPGRFFDAPGHIRISFGDDPAHVPGGLSRLQAALRARGATAEAHRSAESQ
ncbi:MAG: aminotransferase [Anaerolineae bacterium]